MQKIESFQIDHNRLEKGVYVSRVDDVAGHPVTTYDLRVRAPYKDAPMNGAEAHTLEHLGATWLRNREGLKERVVYFGPMGCLTGFYMILQGEPDAAAAADIAREMFRFMADYDGPIPGASRIECGNYEFQDAASARETARRYHDDVLLDITPDRLAYPTPCPCTA